MDAETRTWLEYRLEMSIRSGFRNAATAIDEIEDELYDANAVAREALVACAQRLEREQRDREASWTGTTDNDRLDAAFEALTGRGLVALHRAGMTQSDGWDDVREDRDDHHRGAVFYHGQDVERALDGGGLMLTFGAFDEGDTEALGAEVCEALREQGLRVEWDGTATRRIAVTPFEWRRRRYLATGRCALAIVACQDVHRVTVLKLLRQTLGVQLKTARAALAELEPPDVLGRHHGPPWVVRRGMQRAEAERIADMLRGAGATVELLR